MFVHTWAIVIGALALGLPVAVHWLTRPRPVRLPISTLRFVREAVQQRRVRHRLRDIVILSLRTLAVLCLAFALARPLIGDAETASTDEATDMIRVVLLDVSQSMAATTRGIENFERARPLAGQALDYRPGLKADLILAGARPHGVFEAPSTNFGALREALTAATVRPERFAVQPALNLAADVLARTAEEGVRRELLVVSDFQRTNWASADLSVLPADTVIRLESVAADEPPPNIAILSVAPVGRLEAGRDARLTVEIGNYSSTPRQVRVDVDLGAAVSRLEGTCPPRSRTTLEAPFQVPMEGWRSGSARLIEVDDALAADNQRFCALQARPLPEYALITRERPDQRPTASYFLERALVPETATPDRPQPKVTRVDPADPDPEALTRADAILIVQPGRLPNEMLQRIVALLRRGRGVLYVAADAVDALNLQQLSAAAAPGLQLPVEFQPPPAGAPRGDLFLASVPSNRVPFSAFGDQAAAAVSPLRFVGGLATRRVPGTLDDDVRGAFNDQTAFLVVSSCDGGRLAVMNADLATADLPRSTVFVPLLSELLQQDLLAGDQRNDAFASGEPLTVSLPLLDENAQRLELAGPPDATSDLGRLTQEAGGLVWQAAVAGPPGVYEVRRGTDTLAAVVTAVPAEESDLRALTADVLQQRLAGGRNVVYRAGTAGAMGEQDTLWTWLAAACVLCVIGEVAALRLFRV
jgi:hypothetical protein